MGEKTVVHIFAEEFTEININRMFLGRTVSVQRGEFLLLCCFTALVLILLFLFFLSTPSPSKNFCLLNFQLVFH